jgi:hypothetical protein
MITETKRHLLPRPDEDPEIVRDNYFGTKWPPETNGDLPGYNPTNEAVDESAEQGKNIKSTRAKEKRVIFRKLAPYLGTLVAAATLTGYVAHNKLTQPKSRTVNAFVQPGEGINQLVQRIESGYGHDSYDFDYNAEEYRLSQAHPKPLQPGERLKVHVK